MVLSVTQARPCEFKKKNKGRKKKRNKGKKSTKVKLCEKELE